MASIMVLPSSVADKIAAGEVAERPSAVVKELVENSIDAGADRITVEIKNGGVSYIRIEDNGKGIAPDEIESAFLRHATSKLKNIEDLYSIKTMGFRGEALASICAVADVEAISAQRGAEEGVYLKLSHGKTVKKESIAAAEGTTMIVENLFANVPARMKFLKKDSTEAGYVADTVGRIALSRPDIAFKYICGGKEIFSTTGSGKLKNAVLSIYGIDCAKGIIEVSHSEHGIEVSGVCGRAELARGNRTRQTLFVNGRYIKNHVVSKVVEEAYRNILMTGKFPFFILNINIEPSLVDVNVHPAKTEIKLANEKEVYDVVYRAVKNALYQKTLRSEQGSAKAAGVAQNPFSAGGRPDGFPAADPSMAAGSLQGSEPGKLSQGGKMSGGNIGAFSQGGNPNAFKESRVGGQYSPGRAGGTFERQNPSRSEIKGYLDNLIKAKEIDKEHAFCESVKSEGAGAMWAAMHPEAQQQPAERCGGTGGFSGGTNGNLGINAAAASNEGSGGINSAAENAVNSGGTNINLGGSFSKNAAFGKAASEIGNAENAAAAAANEGGINSAASNEGSGGINSAAENAVNSGAINANENPGGEVNLFGESVFRAAADRIHIVGQVFNTYIIAWQGDKLYMIDQHAAHERLRFEKLREDYKKAGISPQILMEPIVLSLDSNEKQFILENAEKFEGFGFKIEEFGPGAVIIRETPIIAESEMIRDLVLEILSVVKEERPSGLLTYEERALDMISCKYAIKANKALSAAEMESLAAETFALEESGVTTCPHGRPIKIEVSKREIEKMFKRIV